MSQDNAVKKIMVQFSFSHHKSVPEAVKKIQPKIGFESINSRVERKNVTAGECIIEPTANCSAEHMLKEIEAAGFELVDAVYEIRVDAKDPRNVKYLVLAKNIGGTKQLPPGRGYPMVRFVFAQHGIAAPSDDFKSKRNALCHAMESMYKNILWRVRAFNNPFRLNGVEMPGRSLSINLEVRTPLFKDDGTPEGVWLKDENGQRTVKLFNHAEHMLHVTGDTAYVAEAKNSTTVR